MNLATMRTRFKTRLGGLADSESDTDIDTYLNGAYRYLIPERLPGMMTSGNETVNASTSATTYELGAHVHSVYDDGVWNYDGTQLTVHHESSLFFAIAGGATAWLASSDTPTDILIDGIGGSLVVSFYPNSNAVAPVYHQFRLMTREYPSADLTSSGLAHYVHASAVVSGAAKEYARDNSEDELTAKETERFNECIGMLLTRSLSHPRPTRWQPTF